MKYLIQNSMMIIIKTIIVIIKLCNKWYVYLFILVFADFSCTSTSFGGLITWMLTFYFVGRNRMLSVPERGSSRVYVTDVGSAVSRQCLQSLRTSRSGEQRCVCGPVAGRGARHVGGEGDESVREVPGEHFQQEQMSELLQVAGVTSARRPGHGAGNGQRELSPRPANLSGLN